MKIRTPMTLIASLVVIVVLISGCVQQEPMGESRESPPTLHAIQVFDGNTSIGSEADVRTLFSRSSADIFSNTTQTLLSRTHPCGALLQQQAALFQYIDVNYRAWRSDSYWLDGSNYVATVPMVFQNDTWKYENNKVLIQTVECQGAQQILPNGTLVCPPEFGEIEKWENAPDLKYLVDSSGKIYFAGMPTGMPGRQCY